MSVTVVAAGARLISEWRSRARGGAAQMPSADTLEPRRQAVRGGLAVETQLGLVGSEKVFWPGSTSGIGRSGPTRRPR